MPETVDIDKLQPVYNELKSLLCCDRCTMRLLNITGETLNYVSPNEYLEKFDPEYGTVPLKRLKTHPCRICCNLFTDQKLDEIVNSVALEENLSSYAAYTDYNVLVSFPKTILIRNHSILIHLMHKFPEIYNKTLNFLQLNRLFRYSIQDKLTKAINRTPRASTDLQLTIQLDYNDDVVDVKRMEELMNTKYGSFRKKPQISRSVITEVLQVVSDDQFHKHFQSPPEIPTNEATYTGLHIRTTPIFVGGRYVKLNRDMGQTPFIINQVKVVEHCVQDTIFDAFATVQKTTYKLTLTASGREDADVRMLGTGRPFYIQVENPPFLKYTDDELAEVQRLVSKSGLMYLPVLQMVAKDKIDLIKTGEEFKRKTYKALCKFYSKIDVGIIIERINSQEQLTIEQRTPIRVAHRRALMVRPKTIYKMSATQVPNHGDLFELECVTQAGTYVKEFVHGDLGRTTPSLGKIIECPVDIVALDVMNIDLEWP